MNTVLKTTKAALEALDFTEENARYAEIEAELAGFTEAQNKIRARTEEIDLALRDIRDLNAQDAAAAADRLLDGGNVKDIAQAVSTEQNLRDERVSVNATYGELSRRQRELHPELQEIQGRNRQIAMQAAEPLTRTILAEARGAAERLAMAHSAMYAVTSTTRSTSAGSQALEKAFEALRDLFHATGEFPAMIIPDEIRGALMPLQDKGRAAQMHIPTHVYGFAPPPETIRTAPKEPGPSKLHSWAAPAWARTRASITFPG